MSTDKRIKFDVESRWLDEGIDLQNRVIELGDVDFTCANIIRAIKLMESISNDDIRLVIDSPGGCVYTGLRLYDTLVNSPCGIITCGEGQVMSMGTIIYLAGDERYSLPNTTFMCHEISSMSYGKLSEQKIEVEEAGRLEKICLEIMGERTKKSAEWWKKETKHVDRYYDAKAAKKLGMVTHEWE